MSVEKEKWEGELGKTIILASHSLLNERKILFKTIENLKAENEKLKRTMRLHAGDCCSLNNEVELFRGHWQDAEKYCSKLEEALRLTIDRWRLIGRKVWDTKVKVSILELERQLEKDVEQILKG